MKLKKIQLPNLSSLVQSRIDLFYILAFAPLLLVFYYVPFSVIIPFYGFLLLFLKHQKLLEVKQASFVQKVLGAVVVAGSFFVYPLVVLVYPGAAFYGGGNYVAYLFGLFLIFFEFSALKEAFAPLFLIVAATSSIFIAEWLKPFLSPFTSDFAHIIVSILRAFGVNAYFSDSSNPPIVAIPSLSGRLIFGAFVYECIGVYSALVFSIILVVVLFEDPSGLKVKIAYSIAGLLGTFALNIVRVTIILYTDYLYGGEVGGSVHSIIGYALFSAWLACFFFVYSKRQTLNTKIASLWKKIR